MQVNQIDSEIKTILNQYLTSQNITTAQLSNFVGVPKNKIDVLMNKSFDQFQDKVYLKIYIQKILDKILANENQKNDLMKRLDEYCQSQIEKESEQYDAGIVPPEPVITDKDVTDKFNGVDPLYFQTKQMDNDQEIIFEDQTQVMSSDSNIASDNFSYTQRMNEIDSQTQKIVQDNQPRRRARSEANSQGNKQTGGKAWGRVLIALVVVFLTAYGLNQYLFKGNGQSKEKIGIDQPTPTPQPTKPVEEKPAEKPAEVKDVEYTKTFTQDPSFNGISITNESVPIKMEITADKDMTFSYRFTFQQGTPLTEIKIKSGETKTVELNSKNIFIVTENGDTATYKMNDKNFKLPGQGKGANQEQWIQITVK